MKERILLVSCFSLSSGGVQTVIMNIVRHLSHRYTFDIILFTKEKGYYDDEFLSYGGNIFRLPHYTGKNLFIKKVDYYFRGLRLYLSTLKIIKENGPYNAIHCHNTFESAIFLKAAAKSSIPVRIIHSHIIFPDANNVLLKVSRKYYSIIMKKYATNMIGCSEMACEALYGKHSQYTVVPNP